MFILNKTSYWRSCGSNRENTVTIDCFLTLCEDEEREEAPIQMPSASFFEKKMLSKFRYPFSTSAI